MAHLTCTREGTAETKKNMPHPLWSDEYWLPLMQLYLKKPVGVKPLYSRGLVSLSIELHIRPQYLHGCMLRLRSLDTPRLRRLWNTYAESPRRLSRAVSLIRKMKGFGDADDFYRGVDMNESFERDFRPVAADSTFTPVKLIMVLDLYFRLVPATMVAATPEVAELAKLVGEKPDRLEAVMAVFRTFDPCMRHGSEDTIPTLLTAAETEACAEVWRRYGMEPENLASLAAQLKDYWAD